MKCQGDGVYRNEKKALRTEFNPPSIFPARDTLGDIAKWKQKIIKPQRPGSFNVILVERRKRVDYLLHLNDNIIQYTFDNQVHKFTSLDGNACTAQEKSRMSQRIPFANSVEAYAFLSFSPKWWMHWQMTSILRDWDFQIKCYTIRYQ